MEQSKIVCNECGTENEPQYEYCKNCGSPLIAKEQVRSEPAPGYYSNPGFPPVQNNQNMYSPYAPVETIDGIPVDEMATFVGKKSYSVIPKFLSMGRRNSKVSWCWPTAVLSFLFGPFGAALWFFYRKLYKAAWLFVLWGLVVSLASSYFIMRDLPVNIEEIFEEINYVVENSEPDEAEYAVRDIMQEYLNELENYENTASDAVTNFSDIASLVISGMFAYYIYKRKAVEVIGKYRNTNVDPRYYQMGLMSLGGTSGGMLTLGIIIMIFVPSIFMLSMGAAMML